MKRYAVAGIVGAVLLTCCGCGSIYLPDMTVSEFDKVAEYAAYALLANTDGYESKLLSEEDVQRIQEERKLAAEIEAELEAANKPGGNTGNTGTPGSSGEHTGGNTGGGQGSEVTVSDVLSVDGVVIDYAGYQLTKMFPNDSEALFSMRAAEGKQFIVLSFVLQNTGSEQVDCNMLGKEAVYRITVGSGETYRSQFTAFDNDLSTWNTPLLPGSVNMAFLVFQIPEELDEAGIGEIEFSARYDKATKSITLK